MDYPEIYFKLAFFLGAVLQVLLSLSKRFSVKKLIIYLAVLFSALFIAIYFTDFRLFREPVFLRFLSNYLDQDLRLLIVIFVGVLIITRDKVINYIDERIVVSLTLSYWILIYFALDMLSGFWVSVLAGLGAVFTVAVLYIAISKDKSNDGLKALLYFWHMFVNLVFVTVFFKMVFMHQDQSYAFGFSWQQFVLMGMVWVHFFVFLTFFIMNIVVLTSEHGSLKDMKKDYSPFFKDKQLSGIELLIIVLLQGILFLLVSLFDKETSFYFISLWIILTPVISKYLHEAVLSFKKR